MGFSHNYSDETLDQAAELRRKGVAWKDIAEQLSIPAGRYDSFRSVANRYLARRDAAEAGLSAGAGDMENAVLRQQLSELEKKNEELQKKLSEPQQSLPLVTASGTVSAIVSPAYVREIPDYDQLWRSAEQRNQPKIDCARLRHAFSADLSHINEPISVSFISDQHISIDAAVDLKRMREDAELIAGTENAFAVLGGDGVDNHIKHRAAILSQRSVPDDQYHLYNFYLGIIGPSTLVMISGNHDDWTAQIGGIDMVRRIAEGNKVHFAPDEGRVDLSLGKVDYKLACRHQYRYNSTLNLCHTVKRWYDMGDDPFDIGVVCHHHEAATETFNRHGAPRYAARPGSYQITTAYGRQKGYNISYPTCPTFILWPNERRITAFDDLRDGITYLKALKSNGA